MKLFWAPQTRSPRAFWMLEELGIHYDTELVGIRDSERNDSSEFLTASPMGKVPAIEDGDVSLSESAAICLYLADRYSLGDLAPALDSADRGKFLYWMLYTPTVVEPAMVEKLGQFKSNRRSNGWGDFDLMINTFDEALSDMEWILGERFSAADVMLGSSAIFLRMFEMLPETENLDAYADRCVARPAYVAALDKSS